MGRFQTEFLDPSIERRRTLIDAVNAGDADESSLPRDVLTLLRNVDQLPLPADIIQREIACFLLAGAPTSATAFTRSLDNIFTWIECHPEDKARLSAPFVRAAMCARDPSSAAVKSGGATLGPFRRHPKGWFRRCNGDEGGDRPHVRQP